jgi:hypothetical protein
VQGPRFDSQHRKKKKKKDPGVPSSFSAFRNNNCHFLKPFKKFSFAFDGNFLNLGALVSPGGLLNNAYSKK